ncbi:MAG: N-acetylglucosamine-6-phosphate deacetylase, partial [bacterium]|nr:N-acetylglucosamine-6-phosphate deacetylase [bacterium]
DPAGAQILGIHLEGPFINPVKKGGISENCILPASQSELAHIIDITQRRLKMMTVAPELPGNLKIIEQLAKLHIIASFGHSDATYEETQQGINSGIRHVTHLFNAMPPLHHRSPGPIPAIIENQRISVQLIADGVHLHPAIIRWVNQYIGSDRIICITDGIQAIGMPEGRYVYNGRDYISKNGAARYLDGTLIGTALPLNQIARRFKNFTHCTLQQAVDTVSLNPARLLGLENQKGSLDIGKDADLVLMDQNFNVSMTLIDGKIVYRKSDDWR